MSGDDTREALLTTYALGELDDAGRAEVEALLRDDPQARVALAEIEQAVTLLTEGLAAGAPAGLTAAQRRRVTAGPPASERRAAWTWGLAAAAIAAGILAFALAPRGAGDDEDVAGPLAGEPAAAGDEVGDGGEDDPDAPGERVVRAPVPPEPAPAASARLDEIPRIDVDSLVRSRWDSGTQAVHLYVQADKPLYRPGETIWVKTWAVGEKDLALASGTADLRYELVDPRGAVVARKWVKSTAGQATNDFALPAGAPGGEYHVRAMADDGARGVRAVIVASYEAPRVKKKLEFMRKAYGPGDEVAATLELSRATGEPLANHALRGVVRLDGEELPRVEATTNAAGGAVVRFTLPDDIALGDGLLTVLVSDGGVTESISRRVPILMKKLELAFFPEGGDLVAGLESRVYFSGHTPLGKPADVAGRIVDDHGNLVAEFESFDRGMGRLALRPATGRRYFAEVTKPEGVAERYALPMAREDGCVMRVYDDFDGQAEALRVGVRCTEERRVGVMSTTRDRFVDAAGLLAGPGDEAVAYLRAGEAAIDEAQGIARVVLFEGEGENAPVAERVVYRNRRNRLAIEVTADREGYGPRDEVALHITTRDTRGEPVAADLAVAVVDDTVISHADDKRGHILSRLLLEPELPGEVEEPNYYLDLTEARSGRALDLLMGTRGYRRFERREDRVAGLEDEHTRTVTVVDKEAEAEEDVPRDVQLAEVAIEGQLARAQQQVPVVDLPDLAADAADRMQEAEPALAEAGERAAGGDGDDGFFAWQPAAAPRGEAGVEVPVEMLANLDDDGDPNRPAAARPWPAGPREAARPEPEPREYAVVRVFPVPRHVRGYDGPRDDFRDTVLWAPRVKTGEDGKATVSFVLSDAVTSFRAVTEGLGGGAVGRDETVITSSLPFSMEVKLPTAVTSRDEVELPLTLTNRRDEAATVAVTADLGEGLALVDPEDARREVALAAGEARTLMYRARPGGGAGPSRVAFTAEADGLRDAFTREVEVAVAGFPQARSASGRLGERARHDLDLGEALPGSIEASVRLYPSPVATLVQGLEGILREPHGCFEQASSANYPNVMVMNYLRRHDVEDPALMARSARLLAAGYQKLTGYETASRGYEWFGQSPGHEALTAYGLVQFIDMKGVYADVDQAMIDRTAAWLMARRDGRGGYRLDAKALDSFGRASQAVTDAYITYSLAEAGVTGLDAELARAARHAEDADDAYILALATHALSRSPGHGEAARRGAARLVAAQGGDGGWTKADHSVTRSGGKNLWLETTALATMALLRVGGHDAAVERAVGWIEGNRGGGGGFGTTQATILTLKALTRYAETRRVTRGAGTVVALVDGREVARARYEAGHKGPIALEGLGEHLAAGAQTLELVHDGGEAMPYSLEVAFRSLKPASSAAAAVSVATTVDRATVPMGETARVVATVRNVTDAGQPMTLARVGLPGGLTFQTWQLEELRDEGLVAFYETGPSEVVLYFRDLAPRAVKEVPLDLVAVVPGRYEAPASNAYLYYTNDVRAWTAGLKVSVVE